MISVYLNFSELSSWLLLAPLKKLCEELPVDLVWKPMLSSLGNIAGSNLSASQPDPLMSYRSRRADARHRAARREDQRMCERLGITSEQGERKVDPFYLSLGMVWLTGQSAGQQEYFSFAETAFLKTFRDSADVESFSGLQAVMEESGFRTEGLVHFLDNQAPDLEAVRQDAVDNGVFNSPAVVLDGEVFHGREHLPLIKWMLEGRQGIPPV